MAEDLRGAVFMLLCMAGFAANDAVFKLLAGKVPLFQAMFLRGILVSCLLAGLALSQGVIRMRFESRDRLLLGLRCTGEIFGAACFLTALFNMPLANASAILQSLPLAITLTAAILLGESVGWRRYLAIGVGLTGVLIIVRPGSEGFNVWSLFAVAAVGFIVLRDLSTRMVSPGLPAVQVSLITALAVTAASGAVSLFLPWSSVAPADWAALAASGLFLIAGYQFGVLAMRHGDVSIIAPFRYSMLIWAVLLGWAIHGEVPDIWMITGGIIVVVSGLYAFHRERLHVLGQG